MPATEMFITAYGALVFDAQVKVGDFVIIPAASSSVGLAAIQIAQYAGAPPHRADAHFGQEKATAGGRR